MPAWLTQTDVDNYGSELIDVTQRAALHALSPELQAIKDQNAELQRRLATEARRNLDAAVERAIPNYREVDRDPRWHQFLRETDSYTGQPRQALLNIAIADGSANRVIAIFKGFMQEAGSTQQAPAAAPARAARSSSFGNKPIYTRDQIKEIYAQHRRGAYTGREAEFARFEVDLCRASAEGRILNPITDINGK